MIRITPGVPGVSCVWPTGVFGSFAVTRGSEYGTSWLVVASATRVTLTNALSTGITEVTDGVVKSWGPSTMR